MKEEQGMSSSVASEEGTEAGTEESSSSLSGSIQLVDFVLLERIEDSLSLFIGSYSSVGASFHAEGHGL